MTTFGNYQISLEGAVIADKATFDLATARYDTQGVVYDSDATQNWITIDCELTQVTANFGGRMEQTPRMQATVGNLTASLYDPKRIWDATASPYLPLTAPGAPVRLVAYDVRGLGTLDRYDETQSRYDSADSQYGSAAIPIWTGNVDSFEHNLLDGTGQLSASDRIAKLAGNEVKSWQRYSETSTARMKAIRDVPYSPLPYYFEGTGANLCPASLTGDLWQTLGTVADTDQSWIWVDQTGTLRRWSQDVAYPNPINCNDCEDGTSLIYVTLSTRIDENLMCNEVYGNRVHDIIDIPDRVAVNNVSRAKFGSYSLTNTSLQLPTDHAVDTWMQRVLDLRAFPRAGITGMSFLMTDTVPWTTRNVPQILGLGVKTRLLVHLTSRGTPQTFEVLITGISHTITPLEWQIGVDLISVRQPGQITYDNALAEFDTDDRYSVAITPIA